MWPSATKKIAYVSVALSGLLVTAPGRAEHTGLLPKPGPIFIYYSGVVTSGLDENGYFGPAGSSLNNKRFSVKLSGFTDGRSSIVTNCPDFKPCPAPLFGQLLLNQIWGEPLRLNRLTIGSKSVSFGPKAEVEFEHNNGAVADYSIFANNLPFELNLGLYVQGPQAQTPYLRFPLLLSGSSLGSGGFDMVRTIDTETGFYQLETVGNLKVDLFRVSLTPVPEPANWAMMVGGFGLLGAAARRRSRAQVTYA